MNYSEFCKEFKPKNRELYFHFFEEFKDQFQVKNSRLAVKKLEAILTAAFRLAHNQSFANMSMRQLSKKAGLSIGGLYAYFTKKEQLAESIHRFLNHYCNRILTAVIADENRSTLENIIRAHLYTSEFMQPWFFFAFMESKNLTQKQRMYAAGSEQLVENRITEVILHGQEKGWYSKKLAAETSASLIKPLLHDWYLKRGKYKKRNISVDDYAEGVIHFVKQGLSNEST